MRTSMTLNAAQHEQLRQHLFPGDGLEAVALILCGRSSTPSRLRLVAHEVHLVPHERCRREPTRVTWPTEDLPALLTRAAARGLSLIKVHGHAALEGFSETDDEADTALAASLDAWAEGPHGSAIMLQDGRMFGRLFEPDRTFARLDRVNRIGDNLDFWDGPRPKLHVPEHGRRVAQSFGAGTFQTLKALRIAVVGCSGTGSVVIDQLARNGVGELVLIDPDRIELKNLNRIVNSTGQDAANAQLKVDVAAEAVRALEFGTVVETHAGALDTPTALQAVASCDIVFGCMDSVDGRHLLNRLATFHQLAYFDLGVKLEADGHGGVDQVCGTVHYLQPGGSSLFSRHVYSMDEVRAAGLARSDPKAYRALTKEGYIKGVNEDRPAVIQLNSLIASLAVNELLARLHPYRMDPNGDYAIHRVSLSHGIYEYLPDGEPCPMLARHIGRGDVHPPLDMPGLSVCRSVA